MPKLNFTRILPILHRQTSEGLTFSAVQGTETLRLLLSNEIASLKRSIPFSARGWEIGELEMLVLKPITAAVAGNADFETTFNSISTNARQTAEVLTTMPAKSLREALAAMGFINEYGVVNPQGQMVNTALRSLSPIEPAHIAMAIHQSYTHTPESILAREVATNELPTDPVASWIVDAIAFAGKGKVFSASYLPTGAADHFALQWLVEVYNWLKGEELTGQTVPDLLRALMVTSAMKVYLALHDDYDRLRFAVPPTSPTYTHTLAVRMRDYAQLFASFEIAPHTLTASAAYHNLTVSEAIASQLGALSTATQDAIADAKKSYTQIGTAEGSISPAAFQIQLVELAKSLEVDQVLVEGMFADGMGEPGLDMLDPLTQDGTPFSELLLVDTPDTIILNPLVDITTGGRFDQSILSPAAINAVAAFIQETSNVLSALLLQVKSIMERAEGSSGLMASPEWGVLRLPSLVTPRVSASDDELPFRLGLRMWARSETNDVVSAFINDGYTPLWYEGLRVREADRHDRHSLARIQEAVLPVTGLPDDLINFPIPYSFVESEQYHAVEMTGLALTQRARSANAVSGLDWAGDVEAMLYATLRAARRGQGPASTSRLEVMLGQLSSHVAAFVPTAIATQTTPQPVASEYMTRAQFIAYAADQASVLDRDEVDPAAAWDEITQGRDLVLLLPHEGWTTFGYPAQTFLIASILKTAGVSFSAQIAGQRTALFYSHRCAITPAIAGLTLLPYDIVSITLPMALSASHRTFGYVWHETAPTPYAAKFIPNQAIRWVTGSRLALNPPTAHLHLSKYGRLSVVEVRHVIHFDTSLLTIEPDPWKNPVIEATPVALEEPEIKLDPPAIPAVDLGPMAPEVSTKSEGI